TIDLGFAQLLLPSKRSVSFVDVPGHERFVGNMLAGLGPAPIVCLVVAADAGWQAQTTEHRDAIKALGIDTGIIVISRIDLAPDTIDIVSAEIREQLADTGLADAPIVAVSAVDGTGLDEFRSVLDSVLDDVAPADTSQPIRYWVDRAFADKGSVTDRRRTGSLRIPRVFIKSPTRPRTRRYFSTDQILGRPCLCRQRCRDSSHRNLIGRDATAQ